MAKVPEGNKRKPTSKKTFSLADFKKNHGIEDAKDKPLEWIKLSSALQQETGLLGFPKGYACLSRGFSNTGKSTSIAEAVVEAQKMGDLPIIIDTENNFGKERLKLMGFDWDNCIYVDTDYLLNHFGKIHDKNRSQASIEDMAEAVHYFLDQQEAGKLPTDIVFAIDSLGTLDCIKTINAHDKGSADNNQWNAGAFERAFKYILNTRIPSSRKATKPYTNTMIAVQKVWLDNMQGAGVIKHKGGEAFYYGARLIYHFGGVQSHGTKKVNAISKGNKVQYGIEAKIKVEKNQIDGDLGGIALEEGKIISTPHGFIAATKEAETEYKKGHLQYFRKILKDEEITAEDIETNKTIVIKEGEDGGVALFNQMAEDAGVDPETGEVLNS
jgi:hypothetical protein